MEEQPYTYPATPPRKLTLGRILAAVTAVLVLIVVFQAVSAFSIRSRTGVLAISAPAGTNLSISEQNHQAIIIGTGNTKVRLDPGTYLLFGIRNGSQATLVANVSKSQTTHVSLQFKKSSGVRSAQNITFKGEDGLLNAGLTVSQVNQIEQYIFKYKSTANTVAIDQNSIQPGPHDPNANNPFTLNFTVTIDGTPYTATATYSDLQNASLQITNPTTGQVVFDSNSVQQTGGD